MTLADYVQQTRLPGLVTVRHQFQTWGGVTGGCLVDNTEIFVHSYGPPSHDKQLLGEIQTVTGHVLNTVNFTPTGTTVSLPVSIISRSLLPSCRKLWFYG